MTSTTPLPSYDPSAGAGRVPLLRLPPEPRSRTSGGVSDFMRSFLNAGLNVAGGAAHAAAGMDPGYAALLAKQMEVQQQMLLVSFQSNIEKSKHETQMAAVRNARVG